MPSAAVFRLSRLRIRIFIRLCSAEILSSVVITAHYSLQKKAFFTLYVSENTKNPKRF